MEQRRFRKLNIELPTEPVIDDRPGLIAGLFFAAAFLLFTSYAYLKYKGLI